MKRFWDKVEKTDGCWLWTASTSWNGYGQFYFEGTMRRANRVAWLLVNGEIPDGMFVMHSCDNPLCVNPSHLSLGTPKENVHDCINRKRRANNTGNHHNMKKTHCPRGHEYDIVTKNGHRRCRTCRNISWRNMYARRAKAKVK